MFRVTVMMRSQTRSDDVGRSFITTCNLEATNSATSGDMYASNLWDGDPRFYRAHRRWQLADLLGCGQRCEEIETGLLMESAGGVVRLDSREVIDLDERVDRRSIVINSSSGRSELATVAPTGHVVSAKGVVVVGANRPHLWG